jgi:plasmid stabilization system protein ParE
MSQGFADRVERVARGVAEDQGPAQAERLAVDLEGVVALLVFDPQTWRRA